MEDDQKLYEKTLSIKKIFQGQVVNLHKDCVELKNGRVSTREVIEHPGGACAIAIDQSKNIFLVKQFRYPYKEELLEIPAGKLDVGESPFECAKRELAEEVGVVGKNYRSLGILYPSPGYSAEKIHVYSCEVDIRCKINLDEDEFLYVVKIPLDKAINMVMSNEIKDAKTQVAILKVYKHLYGV